MTTNDRAAQLQELRDGMAQKSTQVWQQMQANDTHGRAQASAPEPNRQPQASPEDRLAEIDRLLEDDPQNEPLQELRAEVIKDVNPGPSDGGSRQTVPPPSVQDEAAAALAAGDTAKSIAIKTTQLARAIHRRDHGGWAA